jgi:hypothetical protein
MATRTAAAAANLAHSLLEEVALEVALEPAEVVGAAAAQRSIRSFFGVALESPSNRNIRTIITHTQKRVRDTPKATP